MSHKKILKKYSQVNPVSPTSRRRGCRALLTFICRCYRNEQSLVP